MVLGLTVVSDMVFNKFGATQAVAFDRSKAFDSVWYIEISG